MILQKSFLYAGLVLKKQFFLLSMLKTVVQLNIFVDTVTHCLSTFFDKNKVQKNSIYSKYKSFVAL